MSTPNKTSPQDVLIALARVETTLDLLSKDVKEIKDGTKADIEFIKNDKVSRADVTRMQVDGQTVHNDHEARLRFIERYMWGALALVSAGTFALNYFHPFTN